MSERTGAGKRAERPVRITVDGAPIDLSDLAALPSGPARREATERIMAAIQQLTGQELAGGYSEGGRGA